jgi:hypothetical protein
MTRREVAFLIIGLGLGLLLFMAATLEILLSLREPGSYISSLHLDKIALLIPAIVMVVGVALLAYRKKSERNSN